MVEIKVLINEHGQEFVHTVAIADSLDAAHDVLERLHAYFGETNGRITIVEDKRLSNRRSGTSSAPVARTPHR